MLKIQMIFCFDKLMGYTTTYTVYNKVSLSCTCIHRVAADDHV